MHRNIKFTDICDGGFMYVLKDEDERFYRHPYRITAGCDLFQNYDIQNNLPLSFVMKDWTVGDAPDSCPMTLVSDDMTVWHYDLLEGVPVPETHRLTPIINLTTGCRKIQSSLHQDWFFLLY
eukprot:Platyproteum_vivax@DN1891_c0_g1_i1.p1